MRVAVAVITDSRQRVLITRRPHHVPHGGYWEFPGGKLEAGESPEQALIREVKEETGIDILEYQFLGQINHDYGNKTVQLLVFLVTQFNGEPFCQEGQLDMKWVLSHEINPADFPEANQKIWTLLPT
jgi:8-oxo-dGTP diphosphatase